MIPELEAYGKIAAPCPYYEACGGCQAQHIAYEDYKQWKIRSVTDLIERNGIEPAQWGDPVFIPQATRRRATFAALKKGSEMTLGFHRSRSHDIEPINECLLLTASLNAALSNLKDWLPQLLQSGTPTDIQIQDIDGALEMIIVGPFSGGGEATAAQRKIIADMCEALNISRVGWQSKEFAPIEPLISMKPITKQFGDLIVDIPMGTFLQPSAEGEAALVSLVLQGLPKKSKMKIADLYSGCGTFAGPLLKYGSVHAVEEAPQAVATLQASGKKMQGLTAEKRNLAKEPLTVRELRNYDLIVFDPPRAGAGSQCEKLAKSDVKTVIGVSCNPATFARDAKILLAGGYKLKKLTIVDQFIWSPHTEVVGVFTRA